LECSVAVVVVKGLEVVVVVVVVVFRGLVVDAWGVGFEDLAGRGVEDEEMSDVRVGDVPWGAVGIGAEEGDLGALLRVVEAGALEGNDGSEVSPSESFVSC
jgi:hypothetical protein